MATIPYLSGQSTFKLISFIYGNKKKDVFHALFPYENKKKIKQFTMYKYLRRKKIVKEIFRKLK